MNVLDQYIHRKSPIDIPEIRYDYDGSNNLIYQGWGIGKDNPGTDTNHWIVAKYTYDGNNITRVQALTDVNWDDRASHDWPA